MKLFNIVYLSTLFDRILIDWYHRLILIIRYFDYAEEYGLTIKVVIPSPLNILK